MKPTQFSSLLIASFALLSGCGDDGAGVDADAGRTVFSFEAGIIADAGAIAAPVVSDAATPVQDAAPLAAPDAGSAPAVADEWSCAPMTAGGDGKALHQAAHEVLTSMTPCGFSSCHQGNGKAGLVLSGAGDLRTLLVGHSACEAPALSLVDGSGGSAALMKSWLWLKLVSKTDADTALLPNASWGMSKSCGQRPDQPYGLLMPQNSTIEKEKLAPIRAWICAGAPGP